MDTTWITDSGNLAVILGALAMVGGVGYVWLRDRNKGDAPKSGSPGSTAAVEPPATDSDNRLARLRSRLAGGWAGGLLSIFSKGKLSESDWLELEETLLLADVGTTATDELLTDLRQRLAAAPEADPTSLLRDALISAVEVDVARAISVGKAGAGHAAPILVVGVNGVGKTTTIGKLARLLSAQRYAVVLGAADTFRAAAADQLETWGSRAGVPVVRADRDGADPASVAFEAAQQAANDGADVVIIDTAGRLQNKAGLMDELGKISRVVSKVTPPVEVLLVLDATTGQNGLAQARVFAEVAHITGIVLTKLDGSAKGGIVIAVQRELGVPVKFIGLGEGDDDLAPFDATEFVDGILSA